MLWLSSSGHCFDVSSICDVCIACLLPYDMLLSLLCCACCLKFLVMFLKCSLLCSWKVGPPCTAPLWWVSPSYVSCFWWSAIWSLSPYSIWTVIVIVVALSPIFPLNCNCRPYANRILISKSINSYQLNAVLALLPHNGHQHYLHWLEIC